MHNFLAKISFHQIFLKSFQLNRAARTFFEEKPLYCREPLYLSENIMLTLFLMKNFILMIYNRPFKDF
jgi:hypothetical protein